MKLGKLVNAVLAFDTLAGTLGGPHGGRPPGPGRDGAAMNRDATGDLDFRRSWAPDRFSKEAALFASAGVPGGMAAGTAGSGGPDLADTDATGAGTADDDYLTMARTALQDAVTDAAGPDGTTADAAAPDGTATAPDTKDTTSATPQYTDDCMTVKNPAA